MKLNCPIRGILNIDEKSKGGTSYTEEKRRIDLIYFLLKRNYPVENIYLERSVRIGNAGRNAIRFDLEVRIGEETLIVAEVKRDSSKKNSAIEHQLKPAMRLSDAKFGIYWDGFQNLLFVNSATITEHDVFKLPEFGSRFGKEKTCLEQLQPINEVNAFFEKIEDLAHSKGLDKESRFKGFFQILLAKYYDELFNKEDLKFSSGDIRLEIFSRLWKDAYKYYSRSFPEGVKIEQKLTFNNEDLIQIIQLFEGKSLRKSSSKIAQDFFMKFGSVLLKRDLAQFYTPITIVDFIVSLLNIKPTDFVIDPAGGSADFLTGVLQKYKNDKSYENIRENLFYWDLSAEAAQVAFFNMVLNGDGKTKIKIVDSLKDYKQKNGFFNFVITNPPFGSKIKAEYSKDVLENYELSKFSPDRKQEIGILFIERSLNLLQENGILAIILPSGYLNNKEHAFLREWIFKKARVLGVISLPAGAFKGANTGVKTDLLILRKQKLKAPYKVFVATAEKIGFDFSKKNLKEIFMRDELTGELVLDRNNNKVIESDFTTIEKRFSQFAFDESIEGLNKDANGSDYDYFITKDLDAEKKLKPGRHTLELRGILNNKSLTSLGNINGKKSKVKRRVETGQTAKEWLSCINTFPNRPVSRGQKGG